MSIQQTFELALDRRQSGRLAEAEGLCRQILGQQPDHANAMHLLGLIAAQMGQWDAAVDLIGQAVTLAPNAEAYSNLGNVLKEKRDWDAAIAAYRRAIELQPTFAVAHNNLGSALKDKGQVDESIAAYRRAIDLRPEYHEAHHNLGVALREKGELDQAIQAFRQAIALKPDYWAAYTYLSSILLDMGRFEESFEACRRAVALNPEFPDARRNYGMALLLHGDFTLGWAEYEWRLRAQSFTGVRPVIPLPRWDGLPTDRTILLYSEQGFGDAIQFVRYVRLVADRCKNVIVACQPELRRLFEPMPEVTHVRNLGESTPPFHTHWPLMSLPLLFGTTLQTIPNSIPYLQANAADIERWRRRFDDGRPGFKVGLAWAGRRTHCNDRNRSILPAALAALGNTPGVRYFSLQKGESAAAMTAAPDGLGLVDWTEELTDFADTAALIANLDLVITVDTAIAHLAGAMGKPVWTLLSFVTDWRWLLTREDSPWYPTMRLFRQPAIGDWNGVLRRVADELRMLTSA